MIDNYDLANHIAKEIFEDMFFYFVNDFKKFGANLNENQRKTLVCVLADKIEDVLNEMPEFNPINRDEDDDEWADDDWEDVDDGVAPDVW
jgi:predicted nucleic acid-binding protein